AFRRAADGRPFSAVRRNIRRKIWPRSAQHAPRRETGPCDKGLSSPGIDGAVDYTSVADSAAKSGGSPVPGKSQQSRSNPTIMMRSTMAADVSKWSGVCVYLAEFVFIKRDEDEARPFTTSLQKAAARR